MRYLQRMWMLPVLMVAAVLSGCLPVELSVSPDGDVLIPRAEGFVVYRPADGSVNVLHEAERGKAAFAMYSPDGKSALLIEQVGEGGMGQSFRGVLRDPDGRTRQLFSRSNVAYAQWSPDGRYISITRVADQQVAPIEQNMPELIVIDVADGSSKRMASNVGAIHRWMPDGERVVVFQMEDKIGESNYYSGHLTTVDVANDDKSAVVAMAAEHGVHFDVSPDREAAMVAAMKVDAADAEMPDEMEGQSKLYSVDMVSGRSREVAPAVAFAVYSPDGARVLIGSADEEDGVIKVSVAGADGKDPEVIAEDAGKQAGAGGPQASNVYPTWLDDETVLYLSRRAVFGTAGTNLMLTSVKADGTGRTLHQGTIDAKLAAE